jgi:hypothetical protein
MTNSAVTPNTNDIMLFAEQEWHSVAQKIPIGMEEAFGFKNREEVENSSIGIPIRMFYWENGTMVASNDYRLPIKKKKKMVSLLTVSANEEMNTGDFGGSQLARNIQLISDEYRVNIIGILRVHTLSSDFLIFNEKNTSYFIPVTSQTLQNLSQKTILERHEVATLIQSRLSN